MDYIQMIKLVFVYNVTVIVKHAQIKDPVIVARLVHFWVIIDA